MNAFMAEEIRSRALAGRYVPTHPAETRSEGFPTVDELLAGAAAEGFCGAPREKPVPHHALSGARGRVHDPESLRFDHAMLHERLDTPGAAAAA